MQRGRGVFWCGFRRDPPERQLIAPLYSGGQSGEVVWDASISFGFLDVCSFSGVSVGLKKSEPLLRLRLSLDLCACLGERTDRRLGLKP